jgi:hypothetical protein
MFMATNTLFRSTQLAIWLLPIALMAGCSTANLTSEVGSFAEATKAFSTQASETYSEVNKTTFDRRFVDLAAIENSNIIANELKIIIILSQSLPTTYYVPALNFFFF